MNISELSIRRPVMASVLTIIILLFGFIGYSYLGVREYPSVDNPIISVTCSYPGANADVIENQITEPLEQNINGIPGIRSMSSVSSQGQSRITVEFELSVDLETAANDVRDKVSRAQRYLPRDCDPPTVTKADADATPILMVTIQSDKRSLLELSEIADLTVKEQLQTINNVSGVQIWGEKRYSMRLWLDPAKMAGYGITPVDIKNALDRENVELPSGSIEGNTTELTIRTMGLMHTTQEFNDLVVREASNRIIRLSDVGRAELGPQDTRSYMKMNGIPMVGVVVIPQPGANHIDIADAVYQRMETMKKDLPDDVVTSYGFDNTRFIRASIDEVRQTVYEAFILVIIIIFLFLRNWRVTLIPCIVIPVSLIGTFFLMYVAGFSINVLSMLAVVLSVGLVVDWSSYESFVHVIDSMLNQHAKWLEATVREIPWRKPISSMNLLVSSHVWRQDHNGFSHQDPGVTSVLLNKCFNNDHVIGIYFPVDSNMLLAVAEKCYKSTNMINAIIAGKQPAATWLTLDEARAELEKGAAEWEWASTAKSNDEAQIVLASAGDVPAQEIMAAADKLNELGIKFKVVNVVDLVKLQSTKENDQAISDADFADLFTEDKPVLFAYHSYARDVRGLIYDRPNHDNFNVHGYEEQGSTTTPYDMVRVNNIDRYELVAEALRMIDADKYADKINELEAFRQEAFQFAVDNGYDHPDYTDWVYSGVNTTKQGAVSATAATAGDNE